MYYVLISYTLVSNRTYDPDEHSFENEIFFFETEEECKDKYLFYKSILEQKYNKKDRESFSDWYLMDRSLDYKIDLVELSYHNFY